MLKAILAIALISLVLIGGVEAAGYLGGGSYYYPQYTPDYSQWGWGSYDLFTGWAYSYPNQWWYAGYRNPWGW